MPFSGMQTRCNVQGPCWRVGSLDGLSLRGSAVSVLIPDCHGGSVDDSTGRQDRRGAPRARLSPHSRMVVVEHVRAAQMRCSL